MVVVPGAVPPSGSPQISQNVFLISFLLIFFLPLFALRFIPLLGAGGNEALCFSAVVIGAEPLATLVDFPKHPYHGEVPTLRAVPAYLNFLAGDCQGVHFILRGVCVAFHTLNTLHGLCHLFTSQSLGFWNNQGKEC